VHYFQARRAVTDTEVRKSCDASAGLSELFTTHDVYVFLQAKDMLAQIEVRYGLGSCGEDVNRTLTTINQVWIEKYFITLENK